MTQWGDDDPSGWGVADPPALGEVTNTQPCVMCGEPVGMAAYDPHNLDLHVWCAERYIGGDG